MRFLLSFLLCFVLLFSACSVSDPAQGEYHFYIESETGSDNLTDHAETHENGGDDEINVAGLSGLLADDQHVLDSEVLSAISSGFEVNGDIDMNSNSIVELDEPLSGTDAATKNYVDNQVKNIYIKVIADNQTLSTSHETYLTIPTVLNTWVLNSVACAIYNASSSGIPTFGIYNETDSQEMLSTLVTIDVGELNSYTANISAVINTSYDDVVTGDQLRFYCSVSGTGVEGWDFILGFANE